MKIKYNEKLNPLARNLRNNSTLAEVLLWDKLKQRKMSGYQFLRQRPIKDYIVDFFCHKLNLVVEIDGDSHEGKIIKDKIRQKKLEEMGLTVLRFGDHAVKTHIEGVLNTIAYWIEENPPNPL